MLIYFFKGKGTGNPIKEDGYFLQKSRDKGHKNKKSV